MAEIVDGAVVGTVTETEVLEAQLAAAKLGDKLRAEKADPTLGTPPNDRQPTGGASVETKGALREARMVFRLLRGAYAAQQVAEWEAAQEVADAEE